MTNLATIASRTSVVVQSDDSGSNATIAAATEQQAGVMTSEMVKFLNKVREFMSSYEHSEREPQIILPAQSVTLDPRISRIEHRASQVPELAQFIADFQKEVAVRISDIERRISMLEQVGGPAAIPDVSGLREDLQAVALQVLELQKMADENKNFAGLLTEMLSDPTPVAKD